VTNWKALAEAVEPPVQKELLPEVITALENLDAALRPLELALRPETLLWSGPEEEE
jgi:hypothetical protein